MEIICEKCNTRLNIPDEKIPIGQQATVGCPKCKNRVMLNTSSPSNKNATPAVEGKPGSHIKKADSDNDYWDDDASLDFLKRVQSWLWLWGMRHSRLKS